MKRWIFSSLAVLAIVVASGIAGCGAKLPTTTEDTQGDQQDQKLQFDTETIQDDGSGIAVN